MAHRLICRELHDDRDRFALDDGRIAIRHADGATWFDAEESMRDGIIPTRTKNEDDLDDYELDRKTRSRDWEATATEQRLIDAPKSPTLKRSSCNG